MELKAKASYASLGDKDNFLSLGAASKHIWLLAGKNIFYNGSISDKLMKHLDEVKPRAAKKEIKNG
tara:strand:- start:5000 stop:5197 length:198 start_codon:yes stop_codon:yes gene_type:complete